VGYSALLSNTSGGYNTAVGYQALYNNTTTNNNTAVGYWSLQMNTGTDNTAVGVEALRANTTGTSNVAIGKWSGDSNTSGDYNTGLGTYSLSGNQTGDYNIGIGYATMYQNTGGSHNTAVGNYALNWLFGTASYNVALGDSAGFWGNGNNNCTYIGYNAKNTLNTGYTNSVAIGYDARVVGNNMIILGNTSITSLRCNVQTITAISDGRFKNNIAENVPGLAFINKLRPVTYNVNVRKLNSFLRASNNDNTSIDAKERMLESGFIAQDVEQAAKCIGYDFNGVDKPQNENDTYGLRYASFVVPLVKAVQELDKKNDALKAENNSLRDAVQQMQKELKEIKERLDKNK
jgi:hypothetical protein